MTTTPLLSRARLRRDAPIRELAQVLVPPGSGARAASTHRLVWALFADHPDRRRDFLWRESEPGRFYLLSGRPPKDRHGLFELDPPKPFAPVLAAGDRVAFMLRANATVAKHAGPDARGKRADVVMAALHDVAPGERARERQTAVQDAGVAWLARQGGTHGFSVEAARVDRYETLVLERPNAPMRIGVLDLSGTLRVIEPEAFIRAIGTGFGRAKGFGCGLMLIRRA